MVVDLPERSVILQPWCLPCLYGVHQEHEGAHCPCPTCEPSSQETDQDA